MILELSAIGVGVSVILGGLIARCLGYRAEDVARIEEEAAERARMYGKIATYRF